MIDKLQEKKIPIRFIKVCRVFQCSLKLITPLPIGLFSDKAADWFKK